MTTTKELVKWESVINKSNIFNPPNNADVVKQYIKELFTTMYKECEDHEIANIVNVWKKHCNDLDSKIFEWLKRNSKNYTEYNLKSIHRVMHKVRGNVGEIFGEAYVKDGYMNCYDIDSSQYQCVNGFNENKEDGTTVSASNPNIHMGIQIKNWKTTKIKLDVLYSAMFMWADYEYKTPYELKEEYHRIPRQFILSFTDLDNSKFYAPQNLHRDNMVKFIGPYEINSKLGHRPIAFFKRIADDI